MTDAAPGFSRRMLLGAGAGAVATGAGGGFALGRVQDTGPDADALPVAFEGRHQAGIVTPAQDRMYFVALDMTSERRADLVALLRDWTLAARRLTQGDPVSDHGAVGGPPLAPPDDTGEALGLSASRLTLTIGFGPGLFEKDGRTRFGLDGLKPDLLTELPAFSGDRLDPAICGGDIAIQACANDPQVAVHAVRNLVRIAFGRASVRYSQMGFGRTSSTSTTQATPRNLLGFKDGTANIKAEDSRDVDDFVWVAEGDGPDWLVGGSYLVTRKIDMRIETWDRESLDGQESIIGRRKGSGGPMSGGGEHHELDFDARDDDGDPVIGERAHVRLAHPDTNHGAKLLRRGYNFVGGSNGLGQLSAGLFFICYQRNPVTQFVQVQRSLAGTQNDLLNEYIEHVGSGLFACPPGVGQGGFWGEGLFS
jgi:deferrochelatase/peroxidase EfeB